MDDRAEGVAGSRLKVVEDAPPGTRLQTGVLPVFEHVRLLCDCVAASVGADAHSRDNKMAVAHALCSPQDQPGPCDGPPGRTRGLAARTETWHRECTRTWGGQRQTSHEQIQADTPLTHPDRRGAVRLFRRLGARSLRYIRVATESTQHCVYADPHTCRTSHPDVKMRVVITSRRPTAWHRRPSSS